MLYCRALRVHSGVCVVLFVTGPSLVLSGILLADGIGLLFVVWAAKG